MKETELRIGNKLLYQGENTLTVCGILEGEINTIENGYNSIDEFEPLPLTEDILLRFGFEKDSAIEFHIHSDNNHIICVYFEKMRGCYAMIYNGSQFAELRYVHQLQNLFFALTGEQLTMK